MGPLIVAERPPAHSICATFLPPRSADCASVSACSTGAAPSAAREALKPVLLGESGSYGELLMWNVLFVEPCTPGHAPVASVNQPAPVFGGACVSSPWSDAYAPRRSSFRKPGVTPSSENSSTASWRSPSEAKNSSFPLSPPPPW